MTARWLLLLSLVLAGCTSAGKPPPIWVGHLAPLSGPDRDQGDQAVAAINQALAQANEDDFLILNRPLGVRHADSAKGTARAEAVRLLSVNRVLSLVVGPGVQAPAEVVAAARQHGAPVVVLDELADRPGKGVFALAADPARRGEALAEFARQDLKRSRAAIILDESRAVCAVLAEAFAGAWRLNKGELRRWKSTDVVQAELTRWKPDVVLLAVGADRPAKVNEALAVLAGRVLLLYGGEDRDGLPLAGLDGATVYTATAWTSLARPTEQSKPLLDELRKKEGRAPGLAAVLAVDAIGLLRQQARLLTELARTAEEEKRIDRLKDVTPAEEFESVAGTMFWKEGRPVRPLFIVRHQGGKEALARSLAAKR
jgi:branched-chain amino acid transport system substrate-binding protein